MNPASMNVSQQQSHLRSSVTQSGNSAAPSALAVSYFYELKQAGLAPRTMNLGNRRIISVEEAQKWCRERTEASAKVVREARPR